MDCELLEVDADAAYVEGIRLNVAHGLPLTLKERKRAASRLFRMNPPKSGHPTDSTKVRTPHGLHQSQDTPRTPPRSGHPRVSRIPGAVQIDGLQRVCGLSNVTVARLRENMGEVADTDYRSGRDGKVRPLHAPQIRDQVADAGLAHPDASLRAIARLTGSTHETVRSAKADIRCDVLRACTFESTAEAPNPHTPRPVGDLAFTSTKTADVCQVVREEWRHGILAIRRRGSSLLRGTTRSQMKCAVAHPIGPSLQQHSRPA
jgi:hypothetical protein